MKSFFLHVFLCLTLFAFGCECSRSKSNNNSNQNNNNSNNNECSEGEKKCDINNLWLCDGGHWRVLEECGIGELVGPMCDPALLDCVWCISNGTTCQPDGHVYACTSEGRVGDKLEDCDLEHGEDCIEWTPGEAMCGTPCNRARLSRSYMGCEYVAATTANVSLRPPFAENFGLAVDNPGDRDAEITFEGDFGQIHDTIPAHMLKVFLLPFHEELRTGSSPDAGLSLQSGLYPQAAVHVATSQPVTVYQFNPYDYLLSVSGIDYYSYTNDASLLLPVFALGRHYTAVSRATVFYDTVNVPISRKHSPGFVTIVATQDDTTVTVQSTAYTAPGDGVEALAPGAQRTFHLNRRDVLQLVSAQDITAAECPTGEGAETATDQRYVYCNPGPEWDLTGTRIASDKTVAVFSGHNCAFVPYSKWACDHLEEALFPQETWGKHFVVGFTQQVETGSAETNLVRVVAAEDDTLVTFTPASIAAPRTLAAGEWMEVMPAPQQHFIVEASHPVQVAKFMVGQNQWTTQQDALGDPSMGLAVPTEQFRSEYRFTAPPSFTRSMVNIVVPWPLSPGDTLSLDGNPIDPSAFAALGDSGYALAQLPLDNGVPLGSHHIVSSRPSLRFGIEVYGFANYTSYLYPGGLDLYVINVIAK